jgi:predicted DNA-binding transcriptional regulator YafY
MFGIIEGPETTVELLLHGEQTTAFLSSRRLHPTQKFVARPDGKTLLTMRVRGTTELSSFILSQSPWVEVLKPESLRNEVAERLRAGSELYAAPTPPARSRGRVRGQ